MAEFYSFASFFSKRCSEAEGEGVAREGGLSAGGAENARLFSGNGPPSHPADVSREASLLQGGREVGAA
jgi:hypothetical protein